ncbi:hypothetical protein K32_49380 [Kaistia sp. 32K]|uniref:hypothetical protein n=1 Tax=Kaistia sp. 32K TaxID=2795690 RepID=UPI0019151F59|nr:hypothetical protein [Kaistia sp. 32K]BCP56321.1 hypothetical protein K32_49380 [Kaistia sp. 32K]
MSMRLGVVVATHPGDHSVDLVMADNGDRLVGVQVMTPSGSSRSGVVDMPAVPEKANKWDISQRTGQDQIAVVGYINKQPVVTGFIYPQINQFLSKDPRRLIGRHQSDMQWSIDGEANFQLVHPSGTYIRIGESADVEPTNGQNAHGNSEADRNTGRKVNVRIGLAGNAVVLTMTPDGVVTLKMEQDLDIECAGARVKASEGIVFDTPKAHFTGEVSSDGDMIAGGVSAQQHGHIRVQPGNGTSGPPQQ